MEYLLTLQKGNVFDQLLNEMKYALSDLTASELRDIFLSSSGIALKNTAKTKINSVKNIMKFGKAQVSRYKSEGIINSAKNDLNRAAEMIVSLPAKTKSIYDNFIGLPREKQIEVVASTIIIASVYFACAGGTDLEGGLPDLDITIAGIGHHRSIFSHSILLGLGVEFTGRMMLLVLDRMRHRLPEPHHPIWDKIFQFIDGNKEKAIAAMWLGIGTHLIKDANIFSSAVKPYTDLPVHMSMEAHKATFTFNGVTSAAFSKLGDGL